MSLPMVVVGMIYACYYEPCQFDVRLCGTCLIYIYIIYIATSLCIYITHHN